MCVCLSDTQLWARVCSITSFKLRAALQFHSITTANVTSRCCPVESETRHPSRKNNFNATHHQDRRPGWDPNMCESPLPSRVHCVFGLFRPFRVDNTGRTSGARIRDDPPPHKASSASAAPLSRTKYPWEWQGWNMHLLEKRAELALLLLPRPAADSRVARRAARARTRRRAPPSPRRRPRS